MNITARLLYILPASCVQFVLMNVGPRLGQGAFGVVVRALAYGIRDTEPTTIVAVKMAKGRLYRLYDTVYNE